MTTLQRNVHDAFCSAEDLRWIHSYLRGLLDAGTPPEVVEHILRAVGDDFREAGRDDLADLVLDGLDFLTGWCGPDLSLEPHAA